MSERKLAVSGQFYPDDVKEVTRYFNHFNKVLEQNNIIKDEAIHPRALIVPHAGYIYSGFTANMAYQYIPDDIENIIVFGPSHKFAFDGASVSSYDSYPSPFGSLTINKQLASKLIDKFEFLNFYDEVHQEHSTETQFPFINYYKRDKKVLEIIYSQCDYNNLAKVIQELLRDEKNFVIISTDLSHFYSFEEAKQKDMSCINAISSNNLANFTSECEACGLIGVKALIKITSQEKLNIKLLDYRTSADTSKDFKSVVGYASFVIHD